MVSSGKRFTLVIEKYDKENSKVITEHDLYAYFKSNEDIYKYWAFILHNLDTDDSGELKREHYHLVIVLDKQLSSKSIINDIVRYLMVNPTIISIRRYDDVVKGVQYLIHQNDKDKHQYDLLDIWTNDVNEMLSIILNSVSSYEVDIEYLIKLTESCKTLKQIYKQIGLSKSKEYRSIIIDLWRERFRDE